MVKSATGEVFHAVFCLAVVLGFAACTSAGGGGEKLIKNSSTNANQSDGKKDAHEKKSPSLLLHFVSRCKVLSSPIGGFFGALHGYIALRAFRTLPAYVPL